MDKDILRIALIAMGVLLIVGIYLRDRFQKKKHDRGKLSPSPTADQAMTGDVNSSVHHNQHSIPLDSFGPALRDEPDLAHHSVHLSATSTSYQSDSLSSERVENARAAALPEIMQFAVIARNQSQFKGIEILRAFADLDMQHGDMNIFHRYEQKNGEIAFSAASLVEPGTFPLDNIGAFETPGLTLFFQPSQVSEPITSLDNLVQACRTLASILGGEIFDGRKRPLTDEIVRELRQKLI